MPPAIIKRASSILGPDGRPLEREMLLDEQATPTMGGIRSVTAEHPSIGLTPQRLAGILRAAEDGDAEAYLALAEDVEEKFLHYRSVLGTRRLQVSQLDVTVEAATDAAEDIANADLVRDALAKLDVAGILFDMLDGLGKGYAVQEILWDLSERQWTARDIVWRDPRWFQLDRVDGTTIRLRDGLSINGQDLVPYKFLVHRPKTKSGLPIRAGLARPASWLHLFQAFAWKDWLRFAEVYGHPVRVGKYRAGATAEDKATLLRAVRNISSDFAAIIPESMVIDFIRAEGTSANADIYRSLVDKAEQLCSKLVLGQTAGVDAIAGGHAVGREHRELQGDIERADARQASATLTELLAKPLVLLNRGPQRFYPTVRVGRPDAWDIEKMMPQVERFVTLGGEVGMSTIRDRLGIPDPAPDERLLRPAATTAPAPQPARPIPPATLHAAMPGVTAADPIDAAIAAAAGEWEPIIDEVVAPVMELLDQVSLLEELRDRLAEALRGRDPERLAQLLGRLGFAAHLSGAIEALGQPSEEDLA
jgi:phage gp29-like protein